MPCNGNCTFNSVITLGVDQNMNMTSLTWDSKHGATIDCVSNIESGSGWFKFKRSTDAAEIRISRKTLNTADPKMGGGGTSTANPDGSTTISGGGLPAGVSFRATQDSHTAIYVKAQGNGHFTSVDLHFVLQLKCYCHPNRNESEQIIRMTYQSAPPAMNNRIKQNGAIALSKPIGAGGFDYTLTWTQQEKCDIHRNSWTKYYRLLHWQRLKEKEEAGTLTPEEQQELRELEDLFRQEADSLVSPKIASNSERLWPRYESDAQLVERAAELIRSGSRQAFAEVLAQIKEVMEKLEK